MGRTPDSGGRFGILSVGTAGTIPYAKSLENTSSSGTLSGKVLTAKLGTYFYIEEPDRSSGIRVNATPPSANIGTILTVSGTMGTVNGEKVITSPSVSMDGSTIINPLGLSTKSLGGGDWFYDDQTGEGQQGVTDGVGLNNIGLLVKIWGKVTASDSANKFFCLGDGSGSVKVSWDWQTSGQSIIPPNVGWTVSVSGISSIAADSARLLRVRSQGDIVLHDPLDTGNPTVAITSPAGTTWHKASNASHITISGTAFDTISGVASVQVKIGSGGQYAPASYNAATYTWSYDWQTPPTGTTRIYAKATDFAGNPTETDKEVTVSNVDVIYVNAARPNDSGNGLSWETAKKTLTAGLSIATSGDEIWVAEGTYVGEYVLPSGVGVYGGFAGTEIVREQRDWKAHETLLEPDLEFWDAFVRLVSVSDVTLDGFTIHYGGWGGVGISNSVNVEISHNTIRDNWNGLSCNSSVASIHDNYLSGNGISVTDCTSEPGVLIVNNTIRDNYNNDVAGIYLSNSTVGIYNNIFVNNYRGVWDYYDDSEISLHNNCAYGCGPYPFPSPIAPDNIIDVDPMLDVDGVHLTAGSPCINTGKTDSIIGSLDIDGGTRVQEGDVDIGVDESNGCWPYTITFTCNPAYAEPEGSVVVTVHVVDWNDDPVAFTRVTFSVTGGEITHINDNEVTGPEYQGFTDSNGYITVAVTRSTMGEAQLTVAVARSCGDGSASDSLQVRFLGPLAPADVVMVLDKSGSMGGHEASYPANASVQAFVRDVCSMRPDTRFGAVMFSAAIDKAISVDEFAVEDFCALVSLAGGGDTAAQVAALNAAAADLETYSSPSHRRFVVYVTDDFIGTDDLSVRLALVQRLDALTGSTGGGVFVSLWQSSQQGGYYELYSQNFTGNPLYPSLAVNGGFDSVNYGPSPAPEPRYLFDNLKNRLLYGF